MRISDWSSDVCSSDLAILQERHERGAMLVDHDILLNEINEYNREKFETEAVELFPGKSPRDVLALPFAVRKAAGIHHPYKLADIPFPHRLEQSHAMLFGTTGAGKTTQLRDLIVQMRQRQNNAVGFDLPGAYVEAFYDPATTHNHNPHEPPRPP